MDRGQRRLLLRELLVEVTSIGASVLPLKGYSKFAENSDKTYNCGRIRGGNPFVEDIVPVDIFEERLTLDLLSVGLTRTETAGRIAR